MILKRHFCTTHESRLQHKMFKSRESERNFYSNSSFPEHSLSLLLVGFRSWCFPCQSYPRFTLEWNLLSQHLISRVVPACALVWSQSAAKSCPGSPYLEFMEDGGLFDPSRDTLGPWMRCYLLPAIALSDIRWCSALSRDVVRRMKTGWFCWVWFG